MNNKFFLNFFRYIRDKLAVIAGLETNKQLQSKLAVAENRIKELQAQLESNVKLGKTELIVIPDTWFNKIIDFKWVDITNITNLLN